MSVKLRRVKVEIEPRCWNNLEPPRSMGEMRQTEFVLSQAELKIGRGACIDGFQVCWSELFAGL